MDARFEVVVRIVLGRIAGGAGPTAAAIVGLGVAAHWMDGLLLLLAVCFRGVSDRFVLLIIGKDSRVYLSTRHDEAPWR